MTDHLEAARDRLGGLHDHLSRLKVALAADDLHAILSAILDHLEADPLDESNHTDRIDRHGDQWSWCDKCNGFRTGGHTVHKSSYGWYAYQIHERCGPVTFAPRPADTQPEPVDLSDELDDLADCAKLFAEAMLKMKEASEAVARRSVAPSSRGWPAVEIDECYGPLTFAPPARIARGTTTKEGSHG